MIQNASRTSDNAASQQAISRRQADSRSASVAPDAEGDADLKSFAALMARHLKSARQGGTGAADRADPDTEKVEGSAGGKRQDAASDQATANRPGRESDTPPANTLTGLGLGQNSVATPEAGNDRMGETAGETTQESGGQEIKGLAGRGKAGTSSSIRKAGHGTTSAVKNGGEETGALRPGSDSQAGNTAHRRDFSPLHQQQATAGEANEKARPESVDGGSRMATTELQPADAHRVAHDPGGMPSWMAPSVSREFAADPVSSPDAAVQVQIPTPVTDPEFPHTFAAQVSILSQQGVSHAELSLNPPNMGPVLIEIRHQGNKIEVDFKAELRDTRHAIESSLSQLRDMLGEQGMELQDTWVRSMTVAPLQESQDAQTLPNHLAGGANPQGQFEGQRHGSGQSARNADGQGAQANPGSAGAQGRQVSGAGTDVAHQADGRRKGARPMAGISFFA